MAAPSPSFVLPTEPLLEQPSRELFTLPLTREAAQLLDALVLEPDLEERSRMLFRTLRKQLGEPRAIDLLGGILHEAVRGHERGTATLAALSAVRAAGRTTIESVRDFTNLHRMITRFEMAQAKDRRLAPEQKALMSDWRAVDIELMPFLMEGPDESGVLPHRLDLGPAGNCRRAFRHLVDKLDEDGVLSPSELKRLVRLARLELTASSMRAVELSETIDPHSTRQVSTVMPILAAIDTSVRDTRAFLSSIEETGRTRMFHERHPLMRDHLEPQEVDALLAQLKQAPGMQSLYRLVHRLDRNPLPTLLVGYHAHWILRMGHVLHRKALREAPFNIVDAVLLALEFVGDGDLRVPASPPVCNALGRAGLGPLRLADGGVSLPFDDFAARALDLPLGLPSPAMGDAGDEETDGKDAHEDVKEMVAANINKISILNGLLRNPKVVSTPGVIMLVVQRCRNLQILSLICDDRKLHTGIANRDVPLAVLRSPMRIPVKTLRKFINVRFVSKVELRRMAMDRNTLRREVCEEIELYLKSLV